MPVEERPELREPVPGAAGRPDARGAGGDAPGAIEQAPARINILDADADGAVVVRGPTPPLGDPAYLAGRSTTMEELCARYRARDRLDRRWPSP